MSSTNTSILEASKETVAEIKKNPKPIVCKRCSSTILREKSAQAIRKEDGIFLPHMQTKPASGDTKGEMLHDFWVVPDMFTFENVGFCKTTGNIKYLICADCEAGPIGAHTVGSTEYYVSTERINE